MGAALFPGDRAVITLIGGLMSGRNKANVTGGFIGAGKAAGVAKSGQQGLQGHGEVTAGQSHE